MDRWNHRGGMGTIVDATVPTEQFALADTFEAVPDAEFETVRVVAHEAGHVMPFLWASTADSESLREALEADATTRAVQRLCQSDGRDLYRIEWEADIRAIVFFLVEGHGTLLSANGQNGRWQFRVLFADHDSVSATYEFFRKNGIDLTIRRVKGVTDSIDRHGDGLSEEQYEALTAAFETDYFGVPRGMTLEELAEKIGVSHQALSERLRRGHRRLISNTLYDAPEVAERHS